MTRSSHSLENTNIERNTHLTHNLKQSQTSAEQTNVRVNRKRKAASKNTLIHSLAWLDATISVWTSLKFCFHFFRSRHFKQYHQTLSPFLPFLVSSLSPPAPGSGWKLWLQLGWSEVMGPPNPPSKSVISTSRSSYVASIQSSTTWAAAANSTSPHQKASQCSVVYC